MVVITALPMCTAPLFLGGLEALGIHVRLEGHGPAADLGREGVPSAGFEEVEALAAAGETLLEGVPGAAEDLAREALGAPSVVSVAGAALVEALVAVVLVDGGERPLRFIERKEHVYDRPFSLKGNGQASYGRG